MSSGDKELPVAEGWKWNMAGTAVRLSLFDQIPRANPFASEAVQFADEIRLILVREAYFTPSLIYLVLLYSGYEQEKSEPLLTSSESDFIQSKFKNYFQSLDRHFSDPKNTNAQSTKLGPKRTQTSTKLSGKKAKQNLSSGSYDKESCDYELQSRWKPDTGLLKEEEREKKAMASFGSSLSSFSTYSTSFTSFSFWPVFSSFSSFFSTSASSIPSPVLPPKEEESKNPFWKPWDDEQPHKKDILQKMTVENDKKEKSIKDERSELLFFENFGEEDEETRKRKFIEKSLKKFQSRFT